MKSTDIIKRLLLDGSWYEVARKGSHIQLKHPVKKGWVTVPHPKKDLPAGTVKSIEKQAQIKLI
jgi:predicted RNA binding protein YcfA (HicA-like mRNA interferase family)